MAEAAGMIAVCGATGRQGGAVARHLIDGGWKVRALTRKPSGAAARALSARGAEVCAADMDDPATLQQAFRGVDGVFSVQNGMACGFEREVQQGCRVGDVAAELGVSLVVYASTAPALLATGVPSWEAKASVERHLQSLGLPLTILRPTAFMELMTDPGYYPAFGTWRLWPKLTGDDRPIPWLAVEDVGSATAAVVGRRDEFVGKDLTLVADARSLAECRGLYTQIIGRPPRSLPMPQWLFDRFTRRDVVPMWQWLRMGTVSLDTEPTRRILPEALTVEGWLRRQEAAASAG